MECEDKFQEEYPQPTASLKHQRPHLSDLSSKRNREGNLRRNSYLLLSDFYNFLQDQPSSLESLPMLIESTLTKTKLNL